MRDGRDSTGDPYPLVIDTSTLQRVAGEHGAVAFGVTGVDVFTGARETLRRHKQTGLSGPLHFTYDDPITATDITESFPWARSLVVFAHSYMPTSGEPADSGPVVGRFATQDHYAPLRQIGSAIVDHLESARHRGEVVLDDNRLVDRAAAARAGVGWIGKSTMLLTPGHGPWLLLGSVATDAGLEPTAPMVRNCGTCVACLPACPTGAITDDGLDAGRCISTWLQASGPIPHWVRPLIERRIYGCDDCLTSCPPGGPSLARHSSTAGTLSFNLLLGLSDAELIDRFGWFYVPHRDPRFLRRNLLVAAGNSREMEAVGVILDHFTHRSSLVRGHAYWALARSLGGGAWRALMLRYADETVPDAIRELELALTMLREPHGG